MKLYYSPGACSLSPHIAMREAGIDFQLQKVDTKTHRLEDNADFYAVNGKGQVPVLELGDGRRLTEGPAIVQYLADLKPAAGLAPAAGTFERTRLQEWLNFTTSELHKGFTPLFSTETPAEFREIAKRKLATRFDWLSGELRGREYLLDTFSVADAYLFTILNWCGYVGIELGRWPVLADYQARIAKRPAVQEAMSAEGLLKKAA